VTEKGEAEKNSSLRLGQTLLKITNSNYKLNIYILKNIFNFSFVLILILVFIIFNWERCVGTTLVERLH
jgi:hypothetical protein